MRREEVWGGIGEEEDEEREEEGWGGVGEEEDEEERGGLGRDRRGGG